MSIEPSATVREPQQELKDLWLDVFGMVQQSMSEAYDKFTERLAAAGSDPEARAAIVEYGVRMVDATGQIFVHWASTGPLPMNEKQLVDFLGFIRLKEIEPRLTQIATGTTLKLAQLRVQGRIEHWRAEKLRRMSRGPEKAEPQPERLRWPDIQIRFTSDFQVQITTPQGSETRTYAEMGFGNQIKRKAGGSKPTDPWWVIWPL